MKKWHLLSIGMLLLQLIYPLCRLIAEALHVNFVFYSQLAYEIVVTGLFVTIGTLRLIKKAPASGWDLLLMPAIIVNSFLLLTNYVSLVFMVISLVFAGVLTFRRKGWAKILVTVVCAPAIIYTFWVAPIAVLFSQEWEPKEVINQIDSPSGRYTAKILVEHVWLDDPETQVWIEDNRCVSVLFGEFQQKSKGLYFGDHQDYKTIRVTWVDEDTLSINGEIYDIE